MKENLKKIRYSMEYRLKRLCGAPGPGKRIVCVISVVIVGTGIHFYVLFSSIYNLGKQDAEREKIEIEHINTPVAIPKDMKDSIAPGGFMDHNSKE